MEQSITSPNKIESASDCSEGILIYPKVVTITNSLAPQPAIEIGNAITRRAGGTNTIQSRIVMLILRETANT